MKRLINYEMYESQQGGPVAKDNSKAVSSIVKYILDDSSLHDRYFTNSMISDLILNFFMFQWFKYFQNKYPAFSSEKYLNKSSLDYRNEFRISAWPLNPGSPISDAAVMNTERESQNIVITMSNFDKYKISVNQILKNYSDSAPFKFKADFLQDLEEKIFDLFTDYLRTMMKQMMLTILGIQHNGIYWEINEAKTILTNFVQNMTKLIPEVFGPIAIQILPDELTPANLSVLKKELPDYFRLVKEKRSGVDRWKTDLSADLGDLGF